MLDVRTLLFLSEEFSRLTGVKENTLSSRIFADSKKLPALRNGADITTGRFNTAFQWFSENWPSDAEWPESIRRPSPSAGDQAESNEAAQ
jgi:hypothetical protein